MVGATFLLIYLSGFLLIENVCGKKKYIFQPQKLFEANSCTANRASYSIPIFPVWGMKKVNQFPLVGKCFWINSQKMTKMGTNFSTNSQCGNMKFNQFPVLVFTEHWKFGNKYFNQFLPGEIPVRINSHFGNKLESQFLNLWTNSSINSHQWVCPN